MHKADSKTKEKEDACPYFRECGGCLYQNVSYKQELKIKEHLLKELFAGNSLLKNVSVDSVIPSPEVYYYRHRLDLKLLNTKTSGVLIGFSPEGKKGVVPIDSCKIAQMSVNNFLPELKQQAVDRLAQAQKRRTKRKYRQASLCVRTGEDGRVFWGGIGKKSLRMKSEDYFFVTLNRKKIYFSLESFFQANFSILPVLFKKLKEFPVWSKDVDFFDLYCGVGLFALGLWGSFRNAYLIESCGASVALARYNQQQNGLKQMHITEGSVEDCLPDILKQCPAGRRIGMIDPPRAGLGVKVRDFLSSQKGFDGLFYLSCHPESLARDLVAFCEKRWKIRRVMPFDFFPRTKHLETLVFLQPE